MCCTYVRIMGYPHGLDVPSVKVYKKVMYFVCMCKAVCVCVCVCVRACVHAYMWVEPQLCFPPYTKYVRTYLQ